MLQENTVNGRRIPNRTARGEGRSLSPEEGIAKALALKESAERFLKLLDNGLESQRAGDNYGAFNSYHQASDMRPSDANSAYLAGASAFQMGDYAKSVLYLARACKIRPEATDYLVLLGKALMKLDKPDRAEKCFRKALLQDPENVDYLCELGKCLHWQRKYHFAAGCFGEALRLDAGHGDALCGLGAALRELNWDDDALTCFEEAVGKEPDKAFNHIMLGNQYKIFGKLEEAKAQFFQAMEINPKAVGAYNGWATAEKNHVMDDRVRTMEELYDNESLTDIEKAPLGFALFDAFHGLKEYDKAFRYLLEANALKRKSVRYNAENDWKTVERILSVFSEEFYDARPGIGVEDATPVFILGMPRSGTSLVEQVLSSHPAVHGAGELNHINLVSTSHYGETKFPEGVLAMGDEGFSLRARNYLKLIRELAPEATHITDKMPHNFLFVGMIRAMFPKATVFHTKRDPMDTCLSIFRKNFGGFHPYSYDLTELGQHYRQYQAFMKHWHKVLPGYVHDIQYEAVVADPENQIRRILDICGLDFHEDCLNFHKTERAVRTASNAQVRRPIYKSSVKAWKKYETQLEPLCAALNYKEEDHV